MKKATKIAALAVALAVVMTAFVVALDQGPFSSGKADTGDDITPPGGNNNDGEDPGDDVPPGDESSATTIAVTKTAEGFNEKRIVNSWDVEKCLIGDDCVQIEPGECAKVSYVIDVEKKVCVTEVSGVRGVITVTNTGDCPTEGLAICDTIQRKDGCGFVDVFTIVVDVSAKPVLQPGECFSYPYEILIADAKVDACFSNVACVMISNLEGCDGAAGVEASAEFTIPCQSCIVIDETAVLSDYFNIPAGFAAVPLTDDIGPWVLGTDDCMEWEFCVEFLLKNREAGRCNTFCINNVAKLVPCDTKCPVEACAKLTVTTGGPETTLCVEKTAAVTSWTEYIAYELNTEDVMLLGSVEYLPGEPELDPVLAEQECVANVHTVTVSGAVKVVNTGAYPTEGLRIVDTIQILDCGEWKDFETICVDTSCKPMLLPGEYFYYPYEVTFTVDDLELAGLASFQFRNVACVEICNYDDDARCSRVFDIAPICPPLRPDMITIETTASVDACDEIKLGWCAPCLNIETSFEYRQTIVVKNFEDKSTVDVCTDIALKGKVFADSQCCNAQDVAVAIRHTESTTVCGDNRDLVMAFGAFQQDYECLELCIFGDEVVVDILAFILYGEGQVLHLDDGSFGYLEGKLLLGGVLVQFEAFDEN